jgi:hypothetical protein
VGVALSGRHREHEREVDRASRLLAAGATVALALMLFTPISEIWLREVAGLAPGLSDFALMPARLLVLLPAMEYWLSFQRSRFILNGQTRIITIASAIEAGGIVLILFLCIGRFNMVGAIAASVAMVCGRFGSNLFMLFAARSADESQ